MDPLYRTLSKKMPEKYHVGDRIVGTVSHIRDQSALITLDDENYGLLCIWELSWGMRRKHNEKMWDYLCLGEKTEAFVKEIKEDGWTILSKCFPETEPLHKLAQKYQNSSEDIILPGIIEKIFPHGFFVDIGEGLVGLVHESRYEPGVHYEEGQNVTVSVISIDEEQRRISLALIC